MPRPLLRAARLAALAACLFACACAAPRPASSPSAGGEQPGSHAAAVVSESARALRELRAECANRVLDYALEDARAVIVLPGILRAGFFYSVQGGNGVLVARRSDGGWSAPVLLSAGGAGFGCQIGLEKQRLVLVIAEDEMLRRILDSGLSLDFKAGYDIVGVREEHGPGTFTSGRPVTAFSDGAGLMAGVAVHGGFVSVNRGLTESYHGPRAGTPEQILKGANAPGLEAFELWNALVTDLPAAQIERAQQPPR